MQKVQSRLLVWIFLSGLYKTVFFEYNITWIFLRAVRMKYMKNCELLAPAGTPEALQTALHFGADAVYLGGPMLQLRAESAGFTFEELQKAAQDVHARGKRMYVTVNCFAENGEIDALAEYGKNLLAAGADAAIVSDLGIIQQLSADNRVQLFFVLF